MIVKAFPRARTSVRQTLRGVVPRVEIRDPSCFWLRRGLNGHVPGNYWMIDTDFGSWAFVEIIPTVTDQRTACKEVQS